MITKYDDFINEKFGEFTESDPEYYGIWNYEWSQGKLDCYQSVTLINNDFNNNRLPLVFGKVIGCFRCTSCELTTLFGAPYYVSEIFSCNDNNLSSLEYCPKYTNEFYCINNPLSSIEDYPLCIVNEFTSTDVKGFREVYRIISRNKEKFEPLLNDKVKFHQMIMRLDPDLIQYYTTIQPPSKKSILFDI